MSSVTPHLNGDSKTGQHTFLLLPVSVEDLHNNRSARNFWIYNDTLGAYSLTGNSAAQNAKIFSDKDTTQITIQGDFLSHRLTREDHHAGIKSEIVSFVPVTEDTVELMWVQVTNTSKSPCIPLSKNN